MIQPVASLTTLRFKWLSQLLVLQSSKPVAKGCKAL